MQYCINLTPDYVSFFSFSDVVLSKPSVSGDKKLNALNSAEDELLLISSLNRLNDESFFEFAIQGNKFYANKIPKVFYSVCLYLMHCLVILISSLFFSFLTNILEWRKRVKKMHLFWLHMMYISLLDKSINFSLQIYNVIAASGSNLLLTQIQHIHIPQ